jgi:hypothetical protein
MHDPIDAHSLGRLLGEDGLAQAEGGRAVGLVTLAELERLEPEAESRGRLGRGALRACRSPKLEFFAFAFETCGAEVSGRGTGLGRPPEAFGRESLAAVDCSALPGLFRGKEQAELLARGANSRIAVEAASRRTIVSERFVEVLRPPLGLASGAATT